MAGFGRTPKSHVGCGNGSPIHVPELASWLSLFSGCVLECPCHSSLLLGLSQALNKPSCFPSWGRPVISYEWPALHVWVLESFAGLKKLVILFFFVLTCQHLSYLKQASCWEIAQVILHGAEGTRTSGWLSAPHIEVNGANINFYGSFNQQHLIYSLPYRHDGCQNGSHFFDMAVPSLFYK